MQFPPQHKVIRNPLFTCSCHSPLSECWNHVYWSGTGWCGQISQLHKRCDYGDTSWPFGQQRGLPPPIRQPARHLALVFQTPWRSSTCTTSVVWLIRKMNCFSENAINRTYLKRQHFRLMILLARLDEQMQKQGHVVQWSMATQIKPVAGRFLLLALFCFGFYEIIKKACLRGE